MSHREQKFLSREISAPIIDTWLRTSGASQPDTVCGYYEGRNSAGSWAATPFQLAKHRYKMHDYGSVVEDVVDRRIYAKPRTRVLRWLDYTQDLGWARESTWSIRITLVMKERMG